jgi:hypothetical protein
MTTLIYMKKTHRLVAILFGVAAWIAAVNPCPPHT